MNYELAFPYLEQTAAWKEGMQYLYSPDRYPLSLKQFRNMQKLGAAAGLFLESNNPNSTFVEFRLDLVKDYLGNLFVTEIQTDDRGLPAVTTTRNAQGVEKPLLPGVVSPLMQSLALKSGKPDFSLSLIYPATEQFYYAGFADFARYCRAENTQAEIIVSSDKNTQISGNMVKVNIPFTGVSTLSQPDFIWDFTQNITSPKLIQTPIDKRFLLQVWDQDTSEAKVLKKYIPLTNPASEVVNFDKNSLILKPISGRWSKGVLIGRYSSDWEWQSALKNPNLLAQQFIDQPREIFTVRTKKGDYVKQPFYSRIEGYYVKNNSQWQLVDILVTCTPNLPVHGMRESIMIPAKIGEAYV